MKPMLEQLSEEESLRLAAGAVVGRIGFTGRYGPVMVQGAAHYLDDQEERTAAAAAGIDPWAAGDKDVYIRIRPALVTGRRISRG